VKAVFRSEIIRCGSPKIIDCFLKIFITSAVLVILVEYSYVNLENTSITRNI